MLSVALSICYMLMIIINFFMAESTLTTWIMMESASLIFLCMMLSESSRVANTSNMLYYILQACFSMNILVFYVINTIPTSMLAVVFVLTKIGAAPLSTLYFFSLSTMEPFIFYLTMTTQKLPPTLMFMSMQSPSWLIMLFILLSSTSMLTLSTTINPLRELLITSSLFNSSWLILTSMVSCNMMTAYFCVYSFTLYFIIMYNTTTIPLMVLMGLPPFPLFFIKLATVFYLLTTPSIMLVSSLFFLYLSSLPILTMYFNMMKTTTYSL